MARETVAETPTIQVTADITREDGVEVEAESEEIDYNEDDLNLVESFMATRSGRPG